MTWLAHVQLYPWLAPFYWLRRRAEVRRREEADRAYGALHPGARFPPAELRYDIVGPCSIAEFEESGRQRVGDLERALHSVGRRLDAIDRLLDFGCGCRRVSQGLEERGLGPKVSACDVNERAVRWCREHLELRECVVNGELPPLPFAADSFDVVWCASVFTHLDEAHQDRWLAELRRVLKADGILLASVHGAYAYRDLPRRLIAELERQGILFAKTNAYVGIHPPWYNVTWHTEAYVRSHWSAFFAIRDYLPRGNAGFQDLVVASKTS